MKVFRSRLAICVCSLSLTVGFTAPGCQQLATFLLKLLIQVGRDIAATYVGKFVEDKLDSWFFNKNSSENQGGDVNATSADKLRGKYNGVMEITVTADNGKKTTVKVSNPNMVRSSPDANWKLDPAIIQTAKERSEESFSK
jgi:hypothetical protein